MSDAAGDAPAKKPSRKEELRLRKLQAQVFGDSSEEEEDDDREEEEDEEQEDEEDGGGEGEEGDAAAGGEGERDAAAAKPPGPLSFRDRMQLVAQGKKADATGA
jgi:hypothetical protein